MKKIISLICALLILLTLLLLITQLITACDATPVEREEISSTSMFVVVEEAYDWTVVYHRQTKVMYVFSRLRWYSNSGTGANSSFTVMLDEDGMPLLWRGE